MRRDVLLMITNAQDYSPDVAEVCDDALLLKDSFESAWLREHKGMFHFHLF
jgi:hypothetical protein